MTDRPDADAIDTLISSLSLLWEAGLRRLARKLAPLIPPKRPKPPRITLLREELAPAFDSKGDSPMSTLVYQTDSLPPPADADVVKRLLYVEVDGEAPQTFDVTSGPAEFKASAGSQVAVYLKDTDDAGNESDASDLLTFTATDTLRPARPGQVAVRVLREEADETTGTTDGVTAPDDSGTPATGDEPPPAGEPPVETPPAEPAEPVEPAASPE